MATSSSIFIASTHAYLMIFTDDGMVYKLKVHEVPDAAASARGKAVVNLINILQIDGSRALFRCASLPKGVTL